MRKIHKKSNVSESLFLKSCSPEACNFIKKETLAWLFSCEFCEISKKTFFYGTLLVAASELKTLRYNYEQMQTVLQ